MPRPRESRKNEQPEKPTPAAAAPRWLPWALVALVALTFGRLATATFVFLDDHGTIAENPRLNPPSWAGVAWYWGHTEGDLYLPVTATLWSALAAATYVPTPDDDGYHLDPHVFHAANVALHMAAAATAYALLRRLGGKPWAAVAGAALFALHPVQVEAVAWASGTKDLLSGLLSLVALWAYVRSASTSSSPMAGGAARRGWFLVATVAFAAATLSKPGAVALPVVAAGIDRFALGRPWRRVVPRLAVWVALCVPVVVVASRAQASPQTRGLPLEGRLVEAGSAIAFYLYKLAWPAKLAFDYGVRPFGLARDPLAVASCAVPVVLAVVVVASRRRWLWAAGVCFVAPLVPVLGLVPFDWQFCSIVADHYLYLAMLGPALALTWWLDRPAAAGEVRVPWTVVAAALVALSSRAAWQTGAWANDVTLADVTLRVTPDSFKAYTLLARDHQRRHEVEAALACYRRATEIEPIEAYSSSKLVGMLMELKRYPEAIDEIKRSLAANASRPPGQRYDPRDAYRAVATMSDVLGRYDDAAHYYELTLSLNPNDPVSRQRLPRVREKLAATRPAATTGAARPAN